jgi:hypothetical protein
MEWFPLMSSRSRTQPLFAKKQRKKRLLLWSRDFATPAAQMNKSLFASFSSEKEVLPA